VPSATERNGRGGEVGPKRRRSPSNS
jgi:hypothetical protein